MNIFTYYFLVVIGYIRLWTEKPHDYYRHITPLFWDIPFGGKLTYRIMSRATATRMNPAEKDPLARDFSQEQADMIRSAMAIWANAIDFPVQIMEGENRIWVPGIDFVCRPPDEDSLGHTIWWTNKTGGNELGRVLVHLSPDLDENDFRMTCIHEIGHALGIRGHSPFPGDLMFRGGVSGLPVPRTKDIATMKRVWKLNKP